MRRAPRPVDDDVRGATRARIRDDEVPDVRSRERTWSAASVWFGTASPPPKTSAITIAIVNFQTMTPSCGFKPIGS
jgi:hypothetical protein